MAPTDRTRSSRHTPKQKRFSLNIRKHLLCCEGDQLHRVLRELVESEPRRVIEKTSEHTPGQPAVDGSAWEWDQMISRGPFNLSHSAIDIEDLMLSGCDLHTFDLKAQQQKEGICH